MQYSSSVDIAQPQEVVRPYIESLTQYPKWMPLVHSVQEIDANTWMVELRAKVGPLARSKRLRMTRTIHSADHVRFERDENDGRKHSPWQLDAKIQNNGGGCTVVMQLKYGGTLWTGGVLDKVLASQVDAGKKGLVSLVHGA